jgi:two-component system, LytTR family, sensor kinase
VRRRLLLAAAILAGWSLWGLFNATRLRMVVDEFGWRQALLYGLPDALIWAALTPLVVYLARLVPPRRHRAHLVVLAHLALATAVAVLQVSIDTTQNVVRDAAAGDPISFSFLFVKLLRYTMHLNVSLYLAIVGITWYVDHTRRTRERERQAAELRAQLSEARLDALRSQIQPHFLFNALHTVSALVEVDPAAARAVVHKLARLLRSSLNVGSVREIPLREELENVRAYLEIEQVRCADRLRIRVESDEASLACTVPGFILQPLVENAVRHGIGRRAEGGEIEVQAVANNGRLELRVCDNGTGLGNGDGGQLRCGVGLTNTRARLEAAYPGDHTFELSTRREGGVVAHISIPRRP